MHEMHLAGGGWARADVEGKRTSKRKRKRKDKNRLRKKGLVKVHSYGNRRGRSAMVRVAPLG